MSISESTYQLWAGQLMQERAEEVVGQDWPFCWQWQQQHAMDVDLEMSFGMPHALEHAHSADCAQEW